MWWGQFLRRQLNRRCSYEELLGRHHEQSRYSGRMRPETAKSRRSAVAEVSRGYRLPALRFLLCPLRVRPSPSVPAGRQKASARRGGRGPDDSMRQANIEDRMNAIPVSSEFADMLSELVAENSQLLAENRGLRRDARRNRSAFLRASAIAGILLLVAVVGWVR